MSVPPMTASFKLSMLACVVAGAAMLSGCSKEESASTASSSSSESKPAAGSQAVSIDTISAQAQGFSVGPAMSARVVYVFFDAECPHCGEQWEMAKAIKQVRFVWLPISLLNGKSTDQGAAILAAPDPVTAMDGHEESMRAQRGGILVQGNLDAQKAILKKNTELFNSYGFNSVPTLVTKNASTGVVVTHEGALPPAELASWAGVQTP